MTEIALIEATDAFTHVALRGPLDNVGVGAVELKLTTQTVARRKPAIIDLTGVEVLTSLAIGMLVTIARSMHGHGTGLAVIATGRAKQILESMALQPLLPVHPSREEALRSLGLTNQSV
ncbi:MAG TPA: STAS domain-containing protein [Candidatus Polarisedimenticolaceae bacterium]|nr:STAS domain-containing protein [Candidatus Polarisedimenticolaceae bacterium]